MELKIPDFGSRHMHFRRLFPGQPLGPWSSCRLLPPLSKGDRDNACVYNFSLCSQSPGLVTGNFTYGGDVNVLVIFLDALMSHRSDAVLVFGGTPKKKEDWEIEYVDYHDELDEDIGFGSFYSIHIPVHVDGYFPSLVVFMDHQDAQTVSEIDFEDIH